MKTFSKRAAFVAAWERFKENALFLIGLVVISTVASVALGAIAASIADYKIVIAFRILAFIANVMISMGVTFVSLKIFDGIPTNYEDMLAPLNLFWKYILTALIVMIATSFGVLLFVIPGIIVWATFSMAPYLVIDKGMSPFEALHESYRMTDGHRMNLVLFVSIIILFNAIGVLPYGIGLLFTVPMSILSIIYVYRWLQNPHDGKYMSKVSKIIAGLVLALALIAGVIIALGISSISKDEVKERDSQRKVVFDNTLIALELYKDNNGIYPSSIDELYADYLQSDSSTGFEFEPAYEPNEDGSNYLLCTEYENESLGTECESGTEDFVPEDGSDAYGSEVLDLETDPALEDPDYGYDFVE